MKIKRACLKKFWITAVGCFFLAMFVLTDLLNKAETRDLPIGHTYTDRQTVQTKGLASHVGLVDASSAVKVVQVTEVVQQVADLQRGQNDKTPVPVQVMPEEEHPVQNINCSDKSFIYNLTELQKETRLIYNMVPKCGSLGVRGILSKSGNKLHQGNYNIGYDYLAPFHHKTEHLLQMITDDLNGHMSKKHGKHIYQKHLHFIDFSIANQRTPYYMNVIRDPVDHHISLYYFQRENRKLKMFAPWHLLVENTTKGRDVRMDRSYDDCVKTNDMECSSDDFLFTIIPFFCGQEVHCLKPSRRALEQAKGNVDKYFPLVGYVENLGDFFKLGQVLWPQFFNGSYQNYSSGKFTSHKTKARRTEPSDEVKQIMRKKMSLEYEFYEWIKQRFHCMYDIYVTF